MTQLLLRFGLVINLLGFAMIAILYVLLSRAYHADQQEEIQTVSKVVLEAMASSHKASQTVEHLIDIHLQTVSKEIAERLKGRSLDAISLQELLDLKKTYDLAGISLFVRKGDDIVIAKSTDIHELGLSAKSWGYWFTAFQQLMNREQVTVEKGYRSDHFWVGPISKSEWEQRYYKYAYYFDGSSPFMINPYMDAEKVYQLSIESGPNQLIEQISRESALIDRIAVVNVPAFLKGADNQVIEPENDLPVLYGTLDPDLPENGKLLEEAWRTKQMQSIRFEREGKVKNSIYLALPQNRVMVFTTDLTKQEAERTQLITVMIAGQCLSMLLLFVIFHAVTKRQLRPLMQMADHISRVSDGDLTQTLRIHENNEWDQLAEKISQMTEKMRQLILQIKKEIHSLHVLSSLLSQRVYASINSMNTRSLLMTEESKALLVELDACGETIQEYVQAATKLLQQGEWSPADLAALEESVGAMGNKVQQLSALSHSHAGNLVNLSIAFHDSLSELSGIIDNIDHLTEELKEKIGMFRLGE
ncbi:methyl-accepting chemotaxis protein [Brevibacillus sp. SYP-B805]|uniref:methyl-accepting chemotaxis protein n=1 Tax=Brevibacillus sp. SYP-B805 TaxID=1578199 RepID=UPI0013EA9F5E|nr:methyl-accepting chemotaxis protein [Brevibacillus sp. SYP-B805]NGQ94905.1 methyl-accepting chemotaxis protein [Brevibacillus sp. SYP-B805]